MYGVAQEPDRLEGHLADDRLHDIELELTGWNSYVSYVMYFILDSTAWLMASVSIDCFRSTSQIPGRAQVTAVTIARIITHSTKVIPSPPRGDAVS